MSHSNQKITIHSASQVWTMIKWTTSLTMVNVCNIYPTIYSVYKTRFSQAITAFITQKR